MLFSILGFIVRLDCLQNPLTSWYLQDDQNLTIQYFTTMASSLMQRRKLKLVQLKNTIEKVSILNRQMQALESSQFFKRQTKSANNIEDSQQPTPHNTFLSTIPLISNPNQIIKKRSTMNLDDVRTFDQLFETQEVLGEGAHGVVKKCTHRMSGHQYAVKVLKMEDEHFHFLKTNFLNIKKLKHESVIEYKALFLNSKQQKCHLVMEYLPYPRLQRGLSTEQLKAVFCKLLEALEYIHRNNICHRDIKPENILYDRERQVFKIIDFGVSKNMRLRGRYQEMLTKTGTLYYKAPEMFDGGSYTEKVDCWAVGVTLYEMIVGCTPFASEYHVQTIENILRKEPDLECEQFKHCEPFLKDLISRLLKKNPKQRLSCKQAKNHLWFNTNLSTTNVLQSANYPEQVQASQQISYTPLTPIFRLISTKNQINDDSKQVTKTDKKLMKTFLQEMGNTPQNIQQKVSFDFLQSELQTDEFEFKPVPFEYNAEKIGFDLAAELQFLKPKH